MKCVVCGKDVDLISESVSFNPDNDNKPYQRKLYKCQIDDVWIRTEIPKDKLKEVS